jgi:hypothetical protein
VVVAEAVRGRGVISTIDRQVGPVKRRRRGLGPGQLLVGLAETLLAGGNFLVDLDDQRADRAGGRLPSLTPPPSTTAASLARRFGQAQVAGIEQAMAGLVARALRLLPAEQRRRLLCARPTIDLDPTDVEVHGAGKRGVGWNHLGQRAGRPLLATWAEAGVALAAELLAGDQTRPHAAGLPGRALAALPAGVGRPPPAGRLGLRRPAAGHRRPRGRRRRRQLRAPQPCAVAGGSRRARRLAASGGHARRAGRHLRLPAPGMAAADPGDRRLRRHPHQAALRRPAKPPAAHHRPQQLRLAAAGKLERVYGSTVILTSLPEDPVAIEV